ncbi:MAG: hypothetical protein H0U57_12565 [Tatlockia sp.]|nr:hypothetical protein [Tatlockia sp.]
MGRSRMKSDETTQNAGFAAVLGFNLRQFNRYLAEEVRSKSREFIPKVANELIIGHKSELSL